MFELYKEAADCDISGRVLWNVDEIALACLHCYELTAKIFHKNYFDYLSNVK